MSDSIFKNAGIVRTDIYCHDCSKQFIGSLDYDLNGNHEVECPYCGHLHYRVIKNGIVTDRRYDSQAGPTIKISTKGVWKHDSKAIQTHSISHFLRDRWLNRSDDN